MITALREHGGEEAVVRALSDGFADATRWTLYATSIFLFLGFAASVAVWFASRKAPEDPIADDEDAPEPDPVPATVSWPSDALDPRP